MCAFLHASSVYQTQPLSANLCFPLIKTVIFAIYFNPFDLFPVPVIVINAFLTTNYSGDKLAPSKYHQL